MQTEKPLYADDYVGDTSTTGLLAAGAALRAGGSAVDAAIAVQTVLGLVEPQSSGIAGGAFLVFYDAKTAKVTAYNGREKAPAALSE